MSITRDIVAELRVRMGEARPMSKPRPATHLEKPPRRIFPKKPQRQEGTSEHTTALVGIGAVGTRYATDVVLQFQAELAVAHEAVYTELPHGWAAENGLLSLHSRVTDHREFLLRPDLGRRLTEESLELLQNQAERGVDVQPILADGLSAVACMGSGLEVLEHLTRVCKARGMSVGTPMAARYARVWLQDEIGEAINAKVAVIILGERPGLGTGDGLSAYMVYEPAMGKTDGDRNMISNIHMRGTTPEEAGVRLGALAAGMIEQQTSGVELDLTRLSGAVVETGYREPQVRERLVEVNR